MITQQDEARVLHEAADAIAADPRYAPATRLACAAILDARAEAVIDTTNTTKEHRA